MKHPVPAIQTRYAGCHFRSRLEARWAVLFDRLGIVWEYEPEGFETSAGWYLPDFRLNGSWVEVKGGSFTKRDRARAVEFAGDRWERHGEKFRVLQGDIPRPGTYPLFPFQDGLRPIPALLSLSLVHRYEDVVQHADPDSPQVDGRCLGGPTEWRRCPWIPATAESLTLDSLDAALAAARSARFEHGESP